MGSAVPCSEAQLRSAERVYMEVHPGLAWRRTAQRNVPRVTASEASFRAASAAIGSACIASVANGADLKGVPWVIKCLDTPNRPMRNAGWSIRTEQAYVQWICRFILFHGKRHPRDVGGEELTAFLSHLASQRNVAASTQNQALNAILFLYRDVLKIKLPVRCARSSMSSVRTEIFVFVRH
jgi:hypothetical protein